MYNQLLTDFIESENLFKFTYEAVEMSMKIDLRTSFLTQPESTLLSLNIYINFNFICIICHDQLSQNRSN